MKVRISRVFLTIEDREVRLTKSMAKQFPILDGAARWRAAEHGEAQPEPICKVAGRVLGQSWSWLYLVEDEVAGLGWVAAMQPDPRLADTIVEHGGWVDDPSQVPTVPGPHGDLVGRQGDSRHEEGYETASTK